MKIVVDEKTLRIIMIRNGINTISELSNKSGISRPTIMQYLHGKSPLSSSFIRLCQYLEIEPNSILKIEEEVEGVNCYDTSCD